MKPAFDVVYRDLDSSAALNKIISKKLEKLGRFSDQIIRSRVILDTPHQHKSKGKEFRASIELDIKGQPLSISRNDQSIHVAVRDAFLNAERKIKSLMSKQRTNRH